MQTGSIHIGLRDSLAFDQHWLYYTALILDPVLRFGWILTAIFSHNIQHGSVVAFIVAFCEVTRRGMWALIRVENEHCSNVSQQKACRDIPLPYQIIKKEGPSKSDSFDWEKCNIGTSGDVQRDTAILEPLSKTSGVASESLQPTSHSALKRFSIMLANAHCEDFQRKRDSTLSGEGSETGQRPQSNDEYV